MKNYNHALLIVLTFLFTNCENNEIPLEQSKDVFSIKHPKTLSSKNSDCSESTNGYYFNKPKFPVEVRDDFIWGVNGHSLRQDYQENGNITVDNPYYDNVSYTETLNHLKKLGVSMYRNEMHVNREGDLESSEDNEDLDELLNVFSSEGIQILPMIFATRDVLINQPNDNFDYANIVNPTSETIDIIKNTKVWIESYNWALEAGQNFALRKGDSFEYYNIGNEIAYKIIAKTKLPSNTLDMKNSDYFYANIGGGHAIEHYFKSDELARKTISTCAYVKGLIDGIGQNDPNAKFIVNDTRAHYGYLKFLNLMEVEYDIVGWNWYSAFGSITNTDPEEHDPIQFGIKRGTNVYANLTSIGLGKPIWLTEINMDRGSYTKGTLEQANVLRDQILEMYQLPNIKAFITYELYDGGLDPYNAQHYFGLIESPLDPTYKFKPAFNSYRYSIEELKYGYHDFTFAYYLLYKGENRNLIDDNGINDWALKFKDGLSISNFLNKYLDIDAVNFINSTYNLLLDKSSDSSGRDYYLDKLQTNSTREWVIADIISHDSFLLKANNADYNGSSNNENFIYHVFNKLLGRNPGPTDISRHDGRSDFDRDYRRTYALGVLNSDEYKRIFINEQYIKYLERNAESTGLESYLISWTDQKDFLVSILGSDEFWRKSVIRGYCKRY